MTDVLAVIHELYRHGIASGIQATGRGRFYVWLGDEVVDDVDDTRKIFGHEQFSEAARWLQSEACKAHPHSTYARLYNAGSAHWSYQGRATRRF
jgi:hypothetical protein